VAPALLTKTLIGPIGEGAASVFVRQVGDKAVTGAELGESFGLLLHGILFPRRNDDLRPSADKAFSDHQAYAA
jgi:hypothetical protein